MENGAFGKYAVVRFTHDNKAEALKYFELVPKGTAQEYTGEMAVLPQEEGSCISLIRANFDKDSGLLGTQMENIN